MRRRARMLLLVAVGPALLTLAFSAAVFGVLHVLGHRYTCGQVETGALFFFTCWQLIAIWWIWQDKKN